MQQHGGKYFAHRFPLTLGVGSKCHNSTFSEHGHVAYQIKRNHECLPPHPHRPDFIIRLDMSDSSHEITSSCAKLLGSFFKSDVNSKSRLTILFSVKFFFIYQFYTCFGCSKEPCHGDCSFEHPQHMFLLIDKRAKKFSYLQCTYS